MRYFGLTNPLLLIAGFAPIYFYSRLIFESPLINSLSGVEFKEGLILTLLTLVLVLGPIILLMFCKVIIVDKDSIFLIYPFRFRGMRYNNTELVSVYEQLNNNGKISFKETHLYFGSEKRIKFNSFEILNFKGLSGELKKLSKSS